MLTSIHLHLHTAHAMAARVEPPHASRGGSRGYSQEFRTESLTLDALGLGAYSQASVASRNRWRARGNARKSQRGGVVASNLRGFETLLIVIFRLVWPRATADEIAVFVFQNAPTPTRYTRQDISRRETELGFTTKRASTDAKQAFTPINIAKHNQHWNAPPPFGISGTPRAAFIDFD